MMPMVKIGLMPACQARLHRADPAGSKILIIDEKLNEGYIIGCECEAYFIVPRLGLSVECPHCGHTELPATMLTTWTLGVRTEKLFNAAN